jgi:hypothetical protein
MPRVLRALLVVLLVACSSRPPHFTSPSPARLSNPSNVIYVVKRKWHVDIGFATADLQPPLASLRADLPLARYLLFGFGDRHYLLDHDRGFGGMLAALWPGPGLMLVTGLTASSQAAFGEDNVIEIQLTAAQARNAQAFIWESLAAMGNGVTPLQTGPYEGSVYYSASREYSAFHTCNTWAAEVLRAADLPVHTAAVEFSGQIWRQARRVSQHQRAGSSDTN